MRVSPAVGSWHRPLAWFAVGMAVLSVAILAAWSVDDRTLLGSPIWAKPFKFAVSFALYAGTLAWLLGRLPRFRRLGWWLGTAVVAASALEMAIITGQVVRGRRSHFNMDTPLDSTLYSVMGATVVVIYLATLAIGILVLRTGAGDVALTWGVRLGVLVAALGMSVGFVMVAVGAHSVGVPDGGPGLPFVGWSTTGGDLRVGHFLGMHALQVLPLVAVALTSLGRERLSGSQAVRLVQVLGAAYAGVVGLTTWQALRGQSLTSPDTVSLATAGALITVTVTGLVLAVRASTASAAVVTA